MKDYRKFIYGAIEVAKDTYNELIRDSRNFKIESKGHLPNHFATNIAAKDNETAMKLYDIFKY